MILGLFMEEWHYFIFPPLVIFKVLCHYLFPFQTFVYSTAMLAEFRAGEMPYLTLNHSLKI